MLPQATIDGLNAFEKLCGAASVDELRREYSRLIHLATDKTALRLHLTTNCPTILETLYRIRGQMRELRALRRQLQQPPSSVTDLDLDLAFGPDEWTSAYFLRPLVKIICDGNVNWAEAQQKIDEAFAMRRSYRSSTRGPNPNRISARDVNVA